VPSDTTSAENGRTSRTAIWIVLPTLNEGGNIEELLRGIKSELSAYRCGVCVVDGGSVDGTVEKVRRFAEMELNPQFSLVLIHQKRMHWGAQRGGAVLMGMIYGLQHSDWDLFVEMDADLAHKPHDLHKGIQAIADQGYNVAIASKYAADSRVLGRPLFRRMLSITYNSLLRTFLSHKVRDFSNGYRLYDSGAALFLCSQRIRYTSPVYLVDVLAILIAARYKVAEFPSTYEERRKGVSKITFLDYLKAGVGASEITVRHWVGATRKKRNVQ